MLREVLGRVDRHRVTGVHTGALDVLHDAGNEHRLAVALLDVELHAEQHRIELDARLAEGVLRRQPCGHRGHLASLLGDDLDLGVERLPERRQDTQISQSHCVGEHRHGQKRRGENSHCDGFAHGPTLTQFAVPK